MLLISMNIENVLIYGGSHLNIRIFRNNFINMTRRHSKNWNQGFSVHSFSKVLMNLCSLSETSLGTRLDFASHILFYSELMGSSKTADRQHAGSWGVTKMAYQPLCLT